MSKAKPQFIAYGGYGEVIPPAFAYDLNSAELAKYIRASSLVRYGRKPSSNDNDTRPLGLRYSPNVLPITWTPASGSPALVNGGDANIKAQVNATINLEKSYTSNVFIGKNEGWNLTGYLSDYSKNQALKLHQWFWGKAGAGYVFQIRDGKPEIARLSKLYNDADMGTLRVLWTIEEPNADDTTLIHELEEKIFENFESLSFERGLGRDQWLNGLWSVSFVPEPRGVLHIVLEGGDAIAHEATTILETREAGTLWNASEVRMWSSGGVFYLQAGTLLFAPSAKLSFGPFDNGYWIDALGDVTTATNAYFEAGKTAINSQMVTYGDIQFGFELELVSTSRTTTPWVYNASWRLAPGENNASSTVSLDTNDLYAPVDADEPLETNPIMDVELSFDGPFNRRTVKIEMRNIEGKTLLSKPSPHDRVASFLIGDEPLITKGIVDEVAMTDMKTLQPLSPLNATARRESKLNITLQSVWKILEETRCDPPPISDNLPLGAAAKLFLDIAGLPAWRMAGIPDTGIRVGKAALGEDWAERPDSECSCADALRTLFETYGLNQRFFEGRNGVFNMVTVNSTPIGSFNSSSALNSPNTEVGRMTILSPLDITFDSSNFWNDYKVEGIDEKSSARWTIWESIRQPNSPIWIGRKKTYQTLRNSAIRNQSMAQYALRSLIWMYGRNGRRATFNGYFHTNIEPAQVYNGDSGTKWEVLGYRGSSYREDKSSFNLLEVQ